MRAMILEGCRKLSMITITITYNYSCSQGCRRLSLVSDLPASLGSWKQMVDKELHSISWVIQEDVIEMVKAQGITDVDEVDRRVQDVWDDCCFDLVILRSRGGERKTKAEFMRDWLRSGCTWQQSKARLNMLIRVKIDQGEKRPIPPTFRDGAMKRLRDTVIKELREKGEALDEPLDAAEVVDGRVGAR